MATGQAGEAELARINERLEKLNKDFEETVKQSEAANKAIQEMGDTIQNLGRGFENLGNLSDMFNQIKTSAIESAKGMGKGFTDQLNDITEAVKMLPKAFTKDVKFIDVETLRGQKEEAVKLLDEYRNKRKEIGNLIAQKEDEKLATQDAESYDRIVADIKVLNSEQTKYDNLIHNQKQLVSEIERGWDANVNAATRYNETILTMAANYEAAEVRIKQIDEELLKLTSTNKAFRTDASGEIVKTQEVEKLEEERAKLVETNKHRKKAYEYVQRITSGLDEQAKKADELRRRQEQITQENERQLEVRKEIAKIKQTDVKSMSFTDVRQMYSNVEALTLKLRELEKAGQNNSKEYRESKKKLNAYIAKLKEAGIAMDGFKNASSRAKSVLSSLASQFGIVFSVSGILKFMQNIIKITGEFELQEKALGAIIQNQQLANDMFYKMQIMATKSPYNIQQLVSYNRQLAAYRIETEKLLPTMKMLGDVAAGVGVDMQRLILAYGQVKAANYLRGQELRQFSEAGINILGELADKFTEVEGKAVSTGEVFERVSKRMVTFEDVNEVFERLTQKGGTFYEMQQVQAETLRGQIKNLGDAFKIEANKIGSSVSGTVKSAVSMIKTLMKSLETIIGALKVIGVVYIAYKSSLALAIAQEKAHATSMSAEGRRIGLLKFKWQQLTQAVREYFMQVQLGDKSVTKGGFGSFLKGGGWAALATIAVSAVFKIIQSIRQLRSELAEVEKRGNEMYGTLTSDQFFGRRKTGASKGMNWLDVYNGIDNLADKFEYVDHMLEKLRERGIDLSYDFDKNTEHANLLLDEFAERLESTAKLYAEIATQEERMRVYNDAAWSAGGNRSWFNQRSEKDIQQLVATYSQLQSEYASSMDNYFTSIEKFRYKMADSGKELTDNAKNYIAELYELHNLDKQNEYTKRRQLELVRSLRGEYKILLRDLPGGTDVFGEYERRFDEVYREFMKIYSTIEYQLAEGVIKGSDEHLKRIKHSIVSALKDLPEEIQKEIFDRIVNREYKLKVNVDLKWGSGDEKKDMSSYTKYLNKLSDEIQKNVIQSAGKQVKDLVGVNKDGLGELIESMHKEVKNIAPMIYSQTVQGTRNLAEKLGLIPTQEVEEDIKDGWMKLNMADLITIDPSKTTEQLIDDAKKQKDAIQGLLNVIAQVKSGVSEFEPVQDMFKNLLPLLDVPENISDMESVVKTILTLYTRWYEAIGGIDKTTSKSTRNVVSEFNTMINFIKKLNTETEKLGKTFDTYISSDKYKSALEYVRKSFQGEFEAMPAAFKNLFDNLMKDVDFADRGAVKEQLEKLKKLAESDEYSEKASELIRLIKSVISMLDAEVDVRFKVSDDKELQRQVEDAFSDYEITVELQKLGIDADTAKSFFGLDYTDLNTLQKKIFEMQDQFTGDDAVEKYRGYIDKLFKITDKANLDAVKKYSKYLQYEMSERVRVEMEYQKQMGEVFGTSAFSDEQKKDIVASLEKEMNKKLQKMDWDEFKATDYYIEMFQNLEFASTSAINTMLYKLNQLKDSMSELDAAQMKEIAKQMEALEDEMIKRNPFKSLISSMKEWNAAKKAAKTDEGYLSILPPDYEIKSSVKLILDVIDEINKRLLIGTEEAENGLVKLRDRYGLIWEEAKKRDKALQSLSGDEMKDRMLCLGVDIKTDSIDNVKASIKELSESMKYAREQLNALKNPETEDKEQATVWLTQISSIQSLLDILGQLEDSYTKLGDDASMSAIDAEGQYKDLKQTVEGLIATLKRAQTDMDNQKKAVKAIKELAQVFQQVNEKSKGVFDSIMDNLDYLGSATDENTEAWKEFGDAIFDTVTSALTMIPMLVAGFDAAGTAINASMGIIGLIAEAIQLTITLVKALAKIHDNELEAQITTYTKKIDDLKKAYDRYQKAFDAAWDYNKMRRFYDLAQATAEQQIQTYKNMIAVEEDKKKADEEKIEEWKDAIEELQEELLDNREKIMNELGGFGSEEDMGSAAEQFASAWYDAFLETGSGLQALEDTFQSFLENIVKKQLLLRGSQQILNPLFTSINEMLSDGRADAEEVAAIIDRWNNETIGQLNAYYESLGQMFQAAGVGGGLEGLQQGIQGVTEDTAAIIASYMNTIRFDVAQQNSKLDTIVQTLQLDTATNPLIHNLRIIAQQTTDIRVLLDSVVMPNHPNGGSGIKVFMD